jgi:uncharacterized protein YbjT (DUF2867 family)
MPMLDGGKDIGPVVGAILANAPQGVSGHPVLAVSKEMDFTEIAATLAKVTGQDVRYVQSPAGQMSKRDPIIGPEFEQMYDFYNKFGFAGGEKWLRIEEVCLSGCGRSADWY